MTASSPMMKMNERLPLLLVLVVFEAAGDNRRPETMKLCEEQHHKPVRLVATVRDTRLRL